MRFSGSKVAKLFLKHPVFVLSFAASPVGVVYVACDAEVQTDPKLNFNP
jgi:hypothetical protein